MDLVYEEIKSDLKINQVVLMLHGYGADAKDFCLWLTIGTDSYLIPYLSLLMHLESVKLILLDMSGLT